jgi:hypothetical protein
MIKAMISKSTTPATKSCLFAADGRRLCVRNRSVSCRYRALLSGSGLLSGFVGGSSGGNGVRYCGISGYNS